jgi:hypothetical protein
MSRTIREIIARRTDLGTFLVHLTRGDDPRESLESMLAANRIEARSPFGSAWQKLRDADLPTESQNCVCFTETPLEHTHLLLGEILGRDIQLKPYGIAFPKKLGRRIGVNPVWYVDITPGHDWLMNPVNSLIDDAIETGEFPWSAIEKIAPFVEQMGHQPGGFTKEFWWEREWRHRGDLFLPGRVIVLCPEAEILCWRSSIQSLLTLPRVRSSWIRTGD